MTRFALLINLISILLIPACKEDSCLETKNLIVTQHSPIPDTLYYQTWSNGARLDVEFTYSGIDGCDKSSEVATIYNYSQRTISIQPWVQRKGCQCPQLLPTYKRTITFLFDKGTWTLLYPGSSLPPDTIVIK